MTRERAAVTPGRRLIGVAGATATYLACAFFAYVAAFLYFFNRPFHPNGPYAQRTCLDPHLLFGQICRDFTEKGSSTTLRVESAIVFLLTFLVLVLVTRRFTWALLFVPAATLPFFASGHTVWLVSVLVASGAVAITGGLGLVGAEDWSATFRWLPLSVLAGLAVGVGVLSGLTAGPGPPVEQVTEGPNASWPGIELYGIACAGVGRCVAVGDHTSGGTNQSTSAVVVEEHGGTWGAPLDVGPEPSSDLSLVACASSASCIADSGFLADWHLAESDGRWGANHPIRIPGLLPYGTTWGTQTACSPGGGCWLIDSAIISARGTPSSVTRSFAIGETDGRWRAPYELGGDTVLGPGGALKYVFSSSISCWSRHECETVETGTNLKVVATVVQAERDGRWGAAMVVPGLTSGADKKGFSPIFIKSIACTSAGNCLVGGYENGARQVGVVDQEVDGSWLGPRAGIGVAGPYRQSEVLGVACDGRAICAAAGDVSRSYPELPFVQLEIDGRWQRPSLISRLGRPDSVFVNGLACPTTTTCEVIGSLSSENWQATFVARSTGASWSSWLVAADGSTVLEFSTDALSCAGGACWAVGTTYGGASVPIAAYVFPITAPGT